MCDICNGTGIEVKIKPTFLEDLFDNTILITCMIDNYRLSMVDKDRKEKIYFYDCDCRKENPIGYLEFLQFISNYSISQASSP